jgi:hypothetical protein
MSELERLLTVAEEQPLSRSLPVALRVATVIGDEEWISWIKLELMGYFPDNPAMKKDTVVPEYRGVAGQWYDDYGRPLLLGDSGLDFINEIRLRQGVSELEGMAASTNALAMRLTDFSEIIRKNLNVEVTVFQFRPSSVTQVLTNIRVHLLDGLTSRGEKIKTLGEIQIPPQGEILALKPGVYGMSIDLKALWRRVLSSKK